jgi:hypothetical protein
MNCTYTAQGSMVCKNKQNKPLIESFINQTPNEKTTVNSCVSVNRAFSEVASKYSCISKTDPGTCKFEYNCNINPKNM